MTDWNSIVQFPAGTVNPILLNNAADEVVRFVGASRPLGSLERHKPHLLMPAVYDLGRSPEILGPVARFLGTDKFFQWYSVLFVKERHTQGYIPWHYDDYFWGFNSANGCTAWVALEDVTIENGAMEFAPGSPDDANLFVHFENHNLLIRGNNSNFEPKPTDEIKHIVLRAGEFSIHSNKAWHRSGPNSSPKDRLAVAFRFITEDAVPKKFGFIRRGGVEREGRPVPNYFYPESRPAKLFAIGENPQHKKSIMISTFLTTFGDTHRSFLRQLWDLVLMMKTMKFAKLSAKIVATVLGRKSSGKAKTRTAMDNINNG